MTRRDGHRSPVTSVRRASAVATRSGRRTILTSKTEGYMKMKVLGQLA
jgi:hypothetical protein